MHFLYEIFGFFTSLLGSLLLLRAYLWSLAISPRDPLVAFAWKFTDWLVNPVAYIVKPRGNVEWSCLAAALLVAVVQVLLGREVVGFPASAVGFAVAPFAMVVRWGINLVIWGVIIYAVMSFLGSRYLGYRSMMATLIDPFLRPFRRFIPRIGNFDITPIVLFILLSIVLRFVVPLSMGFNLL